MYLGSSHLSVSKRQALRMQVHPVVMAQVKISNDQKETFQVVKGNRGLTCSLLRHYLVLCYVLHDVPSPSILTRLPIVPVSITGDQ